MSKGTFSSFAEGDDNGEGDDTGEMQYDDGDDEYDYIDPDDPSLTDDERHEAIMFVTEDTIAMLYRVRVDHPDAMIDDIPIDAMIIKLEEGLVAMQQADEAYNAVREKVVAARAEMAYTAEMAAQSVFFSYTAYLNRLRPPLSLIRGYYDIQDANELLRTDRWRPSRYHN